MQKQVVDGSIHPDDKPILYFYQRALEVANNLPEDCWFAETGTRSGDTAIVLLRAINESGKKNRWLFTIDPYGDKPYETSTGVHTSFDYGEQHYRNALHSLSKYAWENDLLHCHYRMRSQEFKFMQDNVEFWFDHKKCEPKYGFVYLDGEHAHKPVEEELAYFLPRLCSGGVIVIDDPEYFDLKKLSIDAEVIEDKIYYTKP